MFNRYLNQLFIIPISFVVLISCGGGGGGGGGEPSTPSPQPVVSLSADQTSVLVDSSTNLSWSSTNANSCSASWTSQTTTSGTASVTISTVGNNNFSITCSGAGGNGSASISIEGYRNTDGVVVDGYISGAEVCIDEDNSWTCDSDESSTTSDNDGKFTIKYANGNLVSIGGTDLDSQVLLENFLITHALDGHTDFKALTPVTSVAAFMQDSSLINAVLGIDSSIDVFSFDPVENKGDGDINDYLYEKGNQLTILALALQNVVNNSNSTTDTTQDYFKAIAEEIEKAGIVNFRRVKALNTHPTFIDGLSDLVVSCLEGPIVNIEKASELPEKVKLYPQEKWQWGWNNSSEVWYGRVAMIVFLILFIELISGSGPLHRLGIL